MKTLLLIVSIVGAVSAGVFQQRFEEQYKKIKDSGNGYFSSEGIPYHSVETLMVEAPDHGHETTSEAYSYYIWLEAMNGYFTKDWNGFNKAWETMEKYIIPTHADQPSNSFYNPDKPASFAPELDTPDQYPSPVDFGVNVGKDPICHELESAYGTKDIYGMHWLQDVDNIYGFGDTPGGVCEGGPSSKGPSYMNTFQRGPQESVWRTIPQPTCDSFKYGGPNGYLDLFIKDNNYAKQWKYTNAPDADARAIQAAYWAHQWAKEQGNGGSVSNTVQKAAKMGDYLRYALFDKYFKKIGNCTSKSCPGGNGKESAHYLLSWYYAWGGAANNGGWAWRIGDSAAHFGYQNPLAAYALSHIDELKPKGATAKEDWEMSLKRQIQFYEWLQTTEGAIAGGATNSVGGRYDTPKENAQSTFYGMFYDWEPVYHDPPSNQWFGMQVWSMDRLAQYYYVTGDSLAKKVLDKWVKWVLANTKFNGDKYEVPGNLHWSGAPDAYNGNGEPHVTSSLHVKVVDHSNEVGTGAALARTLSYYAKKSSNNEAKMVAKKILDCMWNNYRDSKGVVVDEPRTDYKRFNEKLSIPSNFHGKMPNGDPIESGATFLSIRSFYKKDPDFPKVEAYLKGGAVPTFKYHRFWAQSDVALAFGAYAMLFNE